MIAELIRKVEEEDEEEDEEGEGLGVNILGNQCLLGPGISSENWGG